MQGFRSQNQKEEKKGKKDGLRLLTIDKQREKQAARQNRQDVDNNNQRDSLIDNNKQRPTDTREREAIKNVKKS